MKHIKPSWRSGFSIFLLFLLSCATHQQEVDFYSSDLFHDVQMAAIFPDSKTFVDCVPKREIAKIIHDYKRQKQLPDFDLRSFVNIHFDLPVRPKSDFESDVARSLEEHITRLWPVLTRNPDDHTPRSSLIPLPYPYVVPGGRFSEVYYWDSYFTMVGLEAQGHFDLIQSMVDNFAFLIDSIGFIPNGNRNYYLSRSQPPFFSLMVELLSGYDSLAAIKYLPVLAREYDFWMQGSEQVANPGDVSYHVVVMEDGSLLNRYWDKKPQPRPESYREDVHLASESGRVSEELYRDLRSAAESGWDFSSRWFREGGGLGSIQTTSVVPVDLNCLLYHLEKMIALGHRLKGENTRAKDFAGRAAKRREAVLRYCWDTDANFFFDYNFIDKKRSSVKSLAGVYPLFFMIAESGHTEGVSKVLKDEFLKPGGLITTLNESGEQWDAPNGWAPLQWMAYKGLMNYGHSDLADQIRSRWLMQSRRVYRATGKMMEKYNVMDTTLLAGGGEYPNQDGFGWTNGVTIAFEYERQIVLK